VNKKPWSIRTDKTRISAKMHFRRAGRFLPFQPQMKVINNDAEILSFYE
jgi:hypothetical protein